MCWGVDPETNEGRCIAMCGGTEDEPVCDDADTLCVVANEGVLNLCMQVCDPVLSDCPPAEVCSRGSDGFTCAPAFGAPPAVGAPCGVIDLCENGSMCMSAAEYGPGCGGAEYGCCSAFCYTDQAFDCPEPEHECEPYPEGAAPAGYETLGLCRIP